MIGDAFQKESRVRACLPAGVLYLNFSFVCLNKKKGYGGYVLKFDLII
jgi:hypothetical protein